MYRIVTISLSKDGRQAGRQFGTVDRGEMSSGELVELLRHFERATSAEREDAEIRVAAAETSGVIRCVGGQLILTTSHEAHLRQHVLGPMDVLEHLDRATTWTPFEPRPAQAEPPPPPRTRPVLPKASVPSVTSLVLSLVAFMAGLVGLCVGIRSALAKPRTEPLPALSAFDDKSEQAATLRNAIGTYTTGPAVGDRTISVKAAGSIDFETIGAKGTIDQVIDTYKPAQHDDSPCLVTAHNGVVDLQGPDTLVYSKDLYHRLP